MTTNSKVRTPIGVGIVQGASSALDDHSLRSARMMLVRLPINDETSQHRQDSNCVTPRATQSGLWVFEESELA